MRKTHSLLLVFSLILFALGLPVAAQEIPVSPPEDVGMSGARLERIDTAMKRYIDRNQVAGIVTLIIREGSVAQFQGYGYLDRDAGTPMPTDAIFRIASQSKAVTSVAAMILLEEGKLLLTDPVSRFIPEFEHTSVAVALPGGGIKVEPANRPITILDLMTHTAGISYGWGPARAAYRWDGIQGWNFTAIDQPIGRVIQRLADLPFDAQPGKQWIYGFNTDILGAVIEKASGQSLTEFFQTRIFDPLKMVDTSFYLPASKLSRLSPVYGNAEDGTLELVERPADSLYYKGPRKCYSGGAGLLSTARDYGRFLQMLLNGGELEGARVLSRKTVELMTSNHVGDLYGNDGFGLGFWITRDLGKSNELGSKGAFGWGGAYHTVYWVDPAEKLVALLMCQLLPARNSDLHQKFHNLVYQSIDD